MFAFPVLLGDIGGTNARFALLHEPGGTVELLPRALTAATPTPVEAIAAPCNPPPASRPAPPSSRSRRGSTARRSGSPMPIG
jgi:glucokinase